MALPTVLAHGQFSKTNIATSFTFSVTGVVDGSYIVVGYNGNGQPVTGGLDGWTTFVDITDINTPRVMGFYRKWNTGDPTSFTFTQTTGVTAGLGWAVIDGADPTTFLDVAPVTNFAASNGKTMAYTVPVTVTADCLLFTFHAVNSSSDQPVEPTGMIALTDVGSRRAGMASEDWPTAGAAATRTWTNATNVWRAGYFIAIRPVPSSAAHPLEGSGVGSSLASATRIILEHPLSGSGVGSSLASATRIALEHPLSGSAIGTSLASASELELPAPAHPLSGSAIGTSYANASRIELGHALSAIALGTSLATGNLSMPGDAFSGSALGTSYASATRLSMAQPLSGSAIGSASVPPADLYVQGAIVTHPLTGVGKGSSYANAMRLTMAQPLAGEGKGSSYANASRITLTHAMQGSALGTSLASAQRIVMGHALSGIAIGVAFTVAEWYIPVTGRMVIAQVRSRANLVAPSRDLNIA